MVAVTGSIGSLTSARNFARHTSTTLAASNMSTTVSRIPADRETAASRDTLKRDLQSRNSKTLDGPTGQVESDDGFSPLKMWRVLEIG